MTEIEMKLSTGSFSEISKIFIKIFNENSEK